MQTEINSVPRGAINDPGNRAKLLKAGVSLDVRTDPIVRAAKERGITMTQLVNEALASCGWVVLKKLISKEIERKSKPLEVV